MKDFILRLFGKKEDKTDRIYMTQKQIALELMKTHLRYSVKMPWSINQFMFIYVQILNIVKDASYEEIDEMLK